MVRVFGLLAQRRLTLQRPHPSLTPPLGPAAATTASSIRAAYQRAALVYVDLSLGPATEASRNRPGTKGGRVEGQASRQAVTKTYWRSWNMLILDLYTKT